MNSELEKQLGSPERAENWGSVPSAHLVWLTVTEYESTLDIWSVEWEGSQRTPHSQNNLEKRTNLEK